MDSNGIELTFATASHGEIVFGIGTASDGGRNTGGGLAANARFTIGPHKEL